jgi:hypothetical protein
MSSTTKEYRRLPGRARSVMSSIRLWQGKDHLLLCSSTSFSEDYKRFYYSDIQVITVRKTVTREVRSILLVALAGVLGLIAFQFEDWLRDFWGVLAGLLLFFSLVDWLRGPTCICHLQTAIQTVHLSSLNRLRTARKTMARLKPLIDEAQGTLTAEEIQSKMSASTEAAPSLSQVLRPPGGVTTMPPPHYHGKAHLILYLLMLADAPITYLSAFHESRWTTVTGALWTAASLVCVIVALVRQRESDMPRRLKNLSLLILASLVAFPFITTFYALNLGLRNPGTAQPNVSLNDPVVLSITWISTILSVTFGLAGLVLLKQFRVKIAQHPTPPSNMPVETIPKS